MKRARRRRAAGDWIAALALTLLLGLGLRAWVVQAVRVAGSSMEPALQSGDIVLVTKYDYLDAAPARGDIVLCAFPGRTDGYVKRVVGLPGETVRLIDGQTYIDGAPLDEPYAAPADKDYETTLGPDQYLVLGDNRPASYDSREADIGSLRSDAFLGRVRCVIWPPTRFGAGTEK